MDTLADPSAIRHSPTGPAATEAEAKAELAKKQKAATLPRCFMSLSFSLETLVAYYTDDARKPVVSM